MRSVGLHTVGASGVKAARQHMRIGERRLLPGDLSQIAADREPVKLLFKGGYLTLNCPI